MGLFVRDDDYNESVRMTGFNRYKQLLSFYAGHWFKLGFLSSISMIPLVAGIIYSIAISSLLVLIPLSLIGGAIMGPVLATLVDSIMRGLRDDTNNRWDNFRKAFRQNFKCSLLSGAFLGFFIGLYSYILYIFLYTDSFVPTKGTLALLLFSVIILLVHELLYWPQMVLFSQPLKQTITNSLLFTSKYLWRILLIVIINLIFLGILISLAPYSLILLPFIGIWYPVFLSQFLLYDYLNEELEIEKKFNNAL